MAPTSAEYQDDLSILVDDELWRRIPHWHVVPDKNSGGVRISKAAFEDHPDGSPMSVVIAKDVLSSKRNASSIIAGRDGFCLAAITAGLARLLGQGIMRRPLEDEPAHAEVFGKKTDSVRKRFAKGAKWVIGPDEI